MECRCQCLPTLQELNEKRITLMEGTALSERDLQRSRAESASAVFLLADRFSPNYQQEDLNVQFQVQSALTYHVVCAGWCMFRFMDFPQRL